MYQLPSPKHLDTFQGAPFTLPNPLSDQFPVCVCSFPLCINTVCVYIYRELAPHLHRQRSHSVAGSRHNRARLAVSRQKFDALNPVVARTICNIQCGSAICERKRSLKDKGRIKNSESCCRHTYIYTHHVCIYLHIYVYNVDI